MERILLVLFLFFLAHSVTGAEISGTTDDPAENGSEGAKPRLWVQFCDATGLEAAHREEIELEVSLIYSGAGVELVWIDECGGPPIESTSPYAARLYILEAIPRALLSRFPHYDRGNGMMGYTPTDPGGTPGAAIWVSRGSVAANASDFGSIPLPPSLLCRALARVIAHELAHRFIQKEHTRKGILRAKMDRHDLTDSYPRHAFFTEKQIRHLLSIADKS